MRPTLSIDNSTDFRLVNADFFPNDLLRQTVVPQTSHKPHIIGCQFHSSRNTRMPVFAPTVSNVIFLIPDEKMTRIDTLRVVAPMEHEQSSRNRFAVSNLPRQVAGKRKVFIDVHKSVPIRLFGAAPQPTGLGVFFHHSGPKSFKRRMLSPPRKNHCFGVLSSIKHDRIMSREARYVQAKRRFIRA